MVQTIKVFGERNTATNALSALIEKNSRNPVAPANSSDLDATIGSRLSDARQAGLPSRAREELVDQVFDGCDPLETWKHAATNFTETHAFEGCHLCFCVRHPASWILGLYRRPYHIHGRAPTSLLSFLGNRWTTVRRERLGKLETTATALYNLKLYAFLDFQSRLAEKNITFNVVHHEDFAVDQQIVFSRIAPFLSCVSSPFTPIESSTKNSKMNRSYYKEHYGQKRWLDDIDAESMVKINQEIDWSVAAVFGYFPE